MRLFLSLLAMMVSFEAGAVSKSFVTEIRDEKTFNEMADTPGGVVRTGAVIKFLIDNRKYPKPGQVYFINGRYCDSSGCPAPFVKLHREWGEKNLSGFRYDNTEFSRVTYHTNDLDKKEFIAGRIQTFESNGKVFYGVWFVEMDLIAEETIQYALAVIKNAFDVQGKELGFVAYSTHQKVTRVAPWLAQNGIAVHNIGELIANVSFLPLNPGEAWGFLRMFPKDPDDLEATEIPVFDVLPLDLAVVAGTITTGFQDVGSHVNLKSKERGTPNIVLRDKEAIEKLRALDGQPVHLKVTSQGYEIEPTTPRIVQEKLEAKLNRKWRVSENDLTDTIMHFDEMCRGKKGKVCLDYASRFGGKVSRLGFLAHEKVIGEGSAMQKKMGYRLTPLGFGLPIRLYKDFVDYNKKINPAFKAALEELIESEMGPNPMNTAAKKAKIEEIQQHFLAAKFPPGMYSRIEKEVLKLKKMVAERYPGEDLNKLKIRSSANVEDIDGFNGAGLHDSFSAKVKKSNASEADIACKLVAAEGDADEVKQEVEPESLACAIKATYGSLWNLRAVRERTFRRFDHRSAMMGLVIGTSYKFREVPQPKLKIAANSVLITRVLNTTTVYGYQLSTQKKNNLVTNPDPGTISELAALTFQLNTQPVVTVLRYAVPEKDQPALTTTVVPEEKMREIVAIGRTIEEAYCESKPEYFPGGRCSRVSNTQRKPKALDLEIKIYSNGELSFKQFREFSGR